MSLPETFDSSIYGEVFVMYSYFDDLTLQEELPRDLWNKVATSFRSVGITLPIQSNEKKGLLHIIDFVTSNKQVILPHTTNSDAVVKVDAIEEVKGVVTLRNGDDVMTMKTGYDTKCTNNLKFGQRFDDITGESPMITDYPRTFDWKCDLLGWNTSYCRVLEEHQCGLDSAGGDVCNDMPNLSSKQCLASMKILNMTGIFREMAPFLAETMPFESFETEWVERTHKVDLTFPCLIVNA